GFGIFYYSIGETFTIAIIVINTSDPDQHIGIPPGSSDRVRVQEKIFIIVPGNAFDKYVWWRFTSKYVKGIESDNRIGIANIQLSGGTIIEESCTYYYWHCRKAII